IAMSRGSRGYWIAFTDARTYAFSPSSAAPTCGPAGASRSDAAARDFFDRLNAERAARGLPALGWDPGLAQYATDWSRDMSVNGFRHSNLGNLLNGGRFGLVGENIASGSAGVSAGGLHVAWMHSDGHRSNMLSPGFDLVGIGVYCAPNGSMFATTSFGRTMGAGPAPSAGTPPVDPVVRPDPGSSTC
ncbi:MAG TPA: CAP domain-containing protein, partial [Acidimicrobiia bacterium]|nr:CAP domain-containing protein [Acidimicrobiia bacterium]